MDKPGSLHRPQRRVLLLGYSGMVGSALLEQCIRSDQVYEILCLGRKEPAFTHFKMRWIASDLLQPGQDAPIMWPSIGYSAPWGPHYGKPVRWKLSGRWITKWW